MQEPSIFTKIYRGDLPGEIIYKDDLCFAILTIEPLTPGHLLVIPIKQIDALWDIDDPLYSHLFAVAKQMAHKIKAAFPHYQRTGMIVEGFGVPHAHLHVFGLTEGLEPTVFKHVTENNTTSAEDLKQAAEKLRAI